jgi:hypothetical protein
VEDRVEDRKVPVNITDGRNPHQRPFKLDVTGRYPIVDQSREYVGDTGAIRRSLSGVTQYCSVTQE